MPDTPAPFDWENSVEYKLMHRDTERRPVDAAVENTDEPEASPRKGFLKKLFDGKWNK